MRALQIISSNCAGLGSVPYTLANPAINPCKSLNRTPSEYGFLPYHSANVADTLANFIAGLDFPSGITAVSYAKLHSISVYSLVYGFLYRTLTTPSGPSPSLSTCTTYIAFPDSAALISAASTLLFL